MVYNLRMPSITGKELLQLVEPLFAKHPATKPAWLSYSKDVDYKGRTYVTWSVDGCYDTVADHIAETLLVGYLVEWFALAHFNKTGLRLSRWATTDGPPIYSAFSPIDLHNSDQKCFLGTGKTPLQAIVHACLLY